jgi:hypothetical protein
LIELKISVGKLMQLVSRKVAMLRPKLELRCLTIVMITEMQKLKTAPTTTQRLPNRGIPHTGFPPDHTQPYCKAGAVGGKPTQLSVALYSWAS